MLLPGCRSKHPGGPVQILFQHCIPLFCNNRVFISVDISNPAMMALMDRTGQGNGALFTNSLLLRVDFSVPTSVEFLLQRYYDSRVILDSQNPHFPIYFPIYFSQPLALSAIFTVSETCDACVSETCVSETCNASPRYGDVKESPHSSF